MTNKKTTAAPLPLWQYWRGLGGWNFYFLVKFALLWAGYLNFHPMLNLVFLAFLLVPIPREKLHRIRHWIAIPLGFALFWHDTWLPGPESIFSQGSQIAGFSASYIWDLIVRFINWSMVGANVSDTQLISSIKRIPSFKPVSRMRSYTEAMISLMVYSVTE